MTMYTILGVDENKPTRLLLLAMRAKGGSNYNVDYSETVWRESLYGSGR